MGNAVAPVALAFAVLGLPGATATTLGLVVTARLVAQVGFLLLGGVIADRFARHRVMVAAAVSAGLTQGAVAALFITGTATPLAVAALATVSGASIAMFDPAARSILPQLVDGEGLQAANALLRLSMNAGSILGAALAGVLVVLVGPGWALAVDAGSFLIAAVLLLTVRGRPAAAGRAGATLVGQLRDGWREFTAVTWIWTMVAQLALANLCIAGGFVVLGPVVARDELGGAGAWAAVLTAQATGLVVGSLVAMRLRPRHQVRTAALFTLGFAPPFFLLGVGAPVVLIAAAMFVTGLSIDVYEVLFQTSLQRQVPAEALSRVMSYDSLGSYVFVPLGLAVAGPIAGAAGTRPTLTAAGILIVVAALGVLTVPAVRAARFAEPAPAEPAPAEPAPAAPAVPAAGAAPEDAAPAAAAGTARTPLP
jgi:MFS family permease